MPEVNPHLLTGSAVFGEAVSPVEAPVFDLLHTTADMHAFVAEIDDARLAVMRFRGLIRRLSEHGYFDNVYDAAATNTAAATFATKTGNCISYTNLFIALARAANLDAHYQIVEVDHPTWNVETGLLIRNNHINVVIEGPRFNRRRGSGYTIDFNLIDPDPQARVLKVSDAYAESLFYANLSVAEILKGHERLGFALLLRGIESEPRNPDLWVNLGAFYGRKQQHGLAIAAYQIARQLNPRDKIVLSGLERSYRALGDTDRADALLQKVRRYRQQNPFFHFAVAQTAYEEGNFQLSLTAIDKAIRLKKRNPRFHFLKSLSQRRLGNEKDAARSLRKAQRYGRFDDLARRYG